MPITLGGMTDRLVAWTDAIIPRPCLRPGPALISNTGADISMTPQVYHRGKHYPPIAIEPSRDSARWPQRPGRLLEPGQASRTKRLRITYPQQ